MQPRSHIRWCQIRTAACGFVAVFLQVSVVDGKPIVCIDMGDGKDPQAVEEQLFLEMQSLTLKRGEAVAQQAQFIIVGPDLPQRALSTISEAAQPSQQSSRPGPAVAQLTGNNTDSGVSHRMLSRSVSMLLGTVPNRLQTRQAACSCDPVPTNCASADTQQALRQM
jgi:hypothetical protein